MNTLENSEIFDEQNENSFEWNEVGENLFQILLSQVNSPLLLRDLNLYESGIRKIIEKEYPDIASNELDIKIKEDILEMNEWLVSAKVEENVWEIVLIKTLKGMKLISVDPDNVSYPDSLTFLDVNGNELVVPVE